MQLFRLKDGELKDDCQKIGQFYLNKNKGNYKAAVDEITNLGIINIVSTNGTCIIYLSRPGLFIGKYGENYELLQKELCKSLHIVEVNHINDLIFPIEPEIEDCNDFSFSDDDFKEYSE